MKFEINNEALVDAIVTKVVQELASLLKNNPKIESNELMTVALKAKNHILGVGL